MVIPYPTFEEEDNYLRNGIDFVIGTDEVGRGAFAGPVVTAAVVLPVSFPRMDEIHDSKLLKAKKREELSAVIKTHATAYAISEIGLSVINNEGIGRATYKSFRKVVQAICKQLQGKKLFLLCDGFSIPFLQGMPKRSQKAIIKGDQKSLSIAAASIIAKVYRDQKMIEFHQTYPQYSFHVHKGYGTKLHQSEIRKYGFSKLHRMSFNLSRFYP